MRRPAISYPVASLVLLATACAGPPRPLVIGFAYPPGESYGAALQLARQTLAADGGREVAILQPRFDTEPSTDFELRQAQELAATPDISVIVGHGSSGSSLAAAPVYNDSGLPHINALATSRLLASSGPWTFSLIPDDAAEGAFIAGYAADVLGARTASIIYVNDGYGTGLRFGSAAAFAGRGISVLDQAPIDGVTDLEVTLRAMLLHGEPDVLVVAARVAQTAAIARLARSLAPRTALIVGDGALVLPTLADSAGPAAAAIHIVAFWLPDSTPPVRDFVARFRRIAGHDPAAFDALNYDALLLAAAAARAAGGDRARVRTWLRSLGTREPGYQGVSGPISFTTRPRHRMLMARIQDRRAVAAAGQ
jgi:branched-chain amino acid transport system substrate-binding protein